MRSAGTENGITSGGSPGACRRIPRPRWPRPVVLRVESLGREQVAGPRQSVDVRVAHRRAPFGFAEEQDAARGVGRLWSERHHVDLHLGLGDGVVDHAGTYLAGRFGEEPPGPGTQSELAAQRFEVRTHDTLVERRTLVAPDGSRLLPRVQAREVGPHYGLVEGDERFADPVGTLVGPEGVGFFGQERAVLQDVEGMGDLRCPRPTKFAIPPYVVLPWATPASTEW